jgi:hypothetical protein
MITTASALKYADLRVGDGPAAELGKRIVFHYTGWLEDGTNQGMLRGLGVYEGKRWPGLR